MFYGYDIKISNLAKEMIDEMDNYPCHGSTKESWTAVL